MRLLRCWEERKENQIGGVLDLDGSRDHKLLILRQLVGEAGELLTTCLWGRDDFVQLVLRIDLNLIFVPNFLGLDDNLGADRILLDHFDELRLHQVKCFKSQIIGQGYRVSILIVERHLDLIVVLLDEDVGVCHAHFSGVF